MAQRTFGFPPKCILLLTAHPGMEPRSSLTLILWPYSHYMPPEQSTEKATEMKKIEHDIYKYLLHIPMLPTSTRKVPISLDQPVMTLITAGVFIPDHAHCCEAWSYVTILHHACLEAHLLHWLSQGQGFHVSQTVVGAAQQHLSFDGCLTLGPWLCLTLLKAPESTWKLRHITADTVIDTLGSHPPQQQTIGVFYELWQEHPLHHDYWHRFWLHPCRLLGGIYAPASAPVVSEKMGTNPCTFSGQFGP